MVEWWKETMAVEEHGTDKCEEWWKSSWTLVLLFRMRELRWGVDSARESRTIKIGPSDSRISRDNKDRAVSARESRTLKNGPTQGARPE